MTIKTRSLTSAIEGHYVSLIIDRLHQEGILKVMARPTLATALAEQFGLDLKVLSCILEFASTHCDMIVEDTVTGAFSVSDSYTTSRMPAHLLDQYVGAYGGCLSDLDQILRDPMAGFKLVNSERHALAFAKAGAAPNELINLFLNLKINSVLELGCGSGKLLLELASSNPLLRAIGIDRNVNMLNQARQACSDEIDGRITWIGGDILGVINDLDDQVRDGIDAIVAFSVANEYFAEKTIETFLDGLSQAFPNRLLFLGDYYGCLGGSPGERVVDQSNASEFRRAILHDVAQVVSGQGVPPQTLQKWQDHYKHAGCTLINASQSTSAGVQRFLHIVQLKGKENAL